MQSYLILYNGIYIPIEAVNLTLLSYIIMNDMYLGDWFNYYPGAYKIAPLVTLLADTYYKALWCSPFVLRFPLLFCHTATFRELHLQVCLYFPQIRLNILRFKMCLWKETLNHSEIVLDPCFVGKRLKTIYILLCKRNKIHITVWTLLIKKINLLQE